MFSLSFALACKSPLDHHLSTPMYYVYSLFPTIFSTNSNRWNCWVGGNLLGNWLCNWGSNTQYQWGYKLVTSRTKGSKVKMVFRIITFQHKHPSGWWFQWFFIFTPIWEGSRYRLHLIQFDEHIFQRGWFNHQPAICLLPNHRGGFCFSCFFFHPDLLKILLIPIEKPPIEFSHVVLLNNDITPII